MVDQKGRVLWGDQIMLRLARGILETQPGATFIADVKASQVLFDEVARLGGDPLMWKTGHSLIKSKMAETGAPLAGEMSGHNFFADRYYGFDDGLYAAVRLLSVVGASGRSLAELRDELPLAGEARLVGRARTVSDDGGLWSAPLAEELRAGSVVLDASAVVFFDQLKSANLGARALRDLVVTYDLANGRIRFVGSE